MAVIRESGGRYASPRAQTLGLKAIVLGALAIGLMVVDHRQQHLALVREGLSAAAYPFQVAAHSPAAAWDWVVGSFATRRTLAEENERLRLEKQKADLRLLRFEAIEQENLRLRTLLDAAPRNADRVMLAGILRVDLDPFRQRVIVDRGTRDGVRRSQPVVDATGVFGQVVNAGPYSSEVILISDVAHMIPVQVARNGLRTIAVGMGDEATIRLSLPYLPRNADVKPGDELLTSGLGGVFPPGYPVARVTEVKRDPSQPLASIVAQPAAALDRANEVLLVWYAPPPLPPAAPPPGTGPATSPESPAPASPPPAGVPR